MTQLAIDTEPNAPERWRDAVIALIPSLRGLAMALSRNSAHADDLVQEALLKAWTHRQTFEAGTNLKAWLFTILRNTWYTTLRKHRREVGDEDGLLAAALTAPGNQHHAVELKDLLKALDHLPPHYREAVVMVGAAGLGYEEAAAIAGLPLGTLKSHVRRGRLRLMELLDPAAPDQTRRA